jgi:hypothetical protein
MKLADYVTSYMKCMKALWLAAIWSTSAIVWAGSSAGDNGFTLFRYKDENGTQVTSRILPPEVAPRGYEIVTPLGDVIEEVPPAPTKEELKQILAAEEQKKYDKSLLLRYGSLADLMKAQKRKREQEEAKISTLTSNLSNIRLQIDAEQSKAAGYERSGRPIPDSVIAALESLYANLETTEDQLKLRMQEQEEAEKRYQRELDRYKEIKGLK